MATKEQLAARRNRALARYSLEKHWMEAHGTTEAGYIQRYGSMKDPEHYGDGGEAIYAADKAALDAAEREALAAIRATQKERLT